MRQVMSSIDPHDLMGTGRITIMLALTVQYICL